MIAYVSPSLRDQLHAATVTFFMVPHGVRTYHDAAFAGDNDRGYDPLGADQAAVPTGVGQFSNPGAVTGPETPLPVWIQLRLDNMGQKQGC
jgi:hypothetical protein